MKTLAELQVFFASDLLPDLRVLESARLKHLKKFTYLRFPMIGLLLCPAGLVFLSEDLFTVIMFEILYICLVIALWAILRTGITNSYKPPGFKTLVMERIVKFIDPAMTYDPKGCVPFSEYAESRIFLNDVSSHYGDDLVTGSIGKTSFAFSELVVSHKPKHSDKNDFYFHGLFFFANFNKRFKSRTYVFPDWKEKRYGRALGNYFLSRDKSHGQLVKLEDPRFEEKFVVYGHDQIEARYILTPNLMRRIRDYREKTGKDIYLSFVNNRLYAAIRYSNKIFEVNLKKSFLDFDGIREYYEGMAQAIGIVEDLDLNTRIWN